MENISWELIRGKATSGYDWPNDGDAVDSTSFMGKLREKTGGNIRFDLPDDILWEYACRAGTTSLFNDGLASTANVASNANLDVLGRYRYNGGHIYDGSTWKAPPYNSYVNLGTAIVGSYLPNKWGLYDMHGNVREACLDWHAVNSTRRARGGSWLTEADKSHSAFKGYDSPGNKYNNMGLRIVAPACIVPGANE